MCFLFSIILAKQHGMNSRRAIFAVATFVQLLVGGAAYAADKQQEADALISRAASLTNLNAADQTAFRLALSWKILTLGSGPTNGNFILNWNGPTQWRQEMGFPGFFQIEVGDGQQIWTKRNLDFFPKPAFQLQTLLGNLWHLGKLKDEKVKNISTKSEHRLKLKCVELQGGYSISRTLCFADSGELLEASISHPQASYKYSDYFAFRDKRFPRTVRVTAGGSAVIETAVEELVSQANPRMETFAAPSGAIASPMCLGDREMKLVHRVRPAYPEAARRAHTQGTVSLYVLIDRNGSVTKPKVIQSAGVLLDQAAMDAVKQWKYDPPTCGGQNASMEADISVVYSISDSSF